MRIIFVNRYYAPDYSATSQMLTDLAAALAADNEVHVVTSRQRYDDPAASLPVREIIDGVRVARVFTTSFGRGRLPGRALDYLSFYVAAALKLLVVVRRADVIVAMTDPPLVSVLAGWIAQLKRARVINWLQDVFPEIAIVLGVGPARGLGGRMLGVLRTRSLRRATTNVVLGRLMRERVARLGVNRGQIRESPNWADGIALQPIPGRENALRTQWGLADRFVVGYSGNFGRVHEFQTLLGAMRALRAESGVAFLLIGDGAQRATLDAAEREQKSANVLSKPYQPRERLGESLSVADVHIVTLRPELEGLVVPSKFYGIAAVGRPTIFIGDPDGEIGTIVREAQCGLCVDQGDTDGLISAITTLRYDLPLRERMSANARKVFEQRFDKPIAVAAWRSLLESVARAR